VLHVFLADGPLHLKVSIDRRRYNQTLDHSRSGGHPILQ
jgi:hypothetical protein